MKVAGQPSATLAALKQHNNEVQTETDKRTVSHKRLHQHKAAASEAKHDATQTGKAIAADQQQALQSVAQRKVTITAEQAKNIARQVNQVTNASGAPELAEPKMPASNTARVMYFLSTMLKMNGQSSVNQLLDNLKHLELNHQISQNVSNALAAQIQQAQQQMQQADGHYQDILGKLSGAEGDLSSAQQTLSDAEQALNQLKPGDAGYDAAKQAVTAARTAVSDAQQNVNALSSERDSSAAVLNSAQQLYQQAMGAADKQVNVNLVPLSRSAADPAGKNSSAGTLALIIGQCIQMMGDLSVNKLKNDLANSDAMQAARQKEMQKKSDEYQEKVRKSEETSKITGCLADILGGLAMLVGAITSIFGGAGVGLMAVGIGLMAADGITEAITGTSLTSMLMEPLMKYVLGPLMDIIGKIVVEIFDKTPLGLLLKAIDDATGLNMMDTIHSVVTAVAAVAVMVALAYVAKSAGKQLMKSLSETMGKLITESVQVAIKQVVKKVVPAMMKNAGKLTSKMMVKVEASFIKNMELMGQYMHLASAGTNLVGNSLVGTLQEDISRMLASLKINEAAVNISREQMKGFVDYYQREQENITAMTSSMSEALMKQQETGRVVLRNMRNVSA